MQRAFFESRAMYDRMAATGKASPVAMVVASAAVGSFEVSPGDDGSTTVSGLLGGIVDDKKSTK